MSTRVLHVSDLHIGARKALHEPELEGAIAELVERVDPALVLRTQDQTPQESADAVHALLVERGLA